MGQDALSQRVASTSRWNAADYARVGSFVAELGAAALDLLDPQPGERILDVGCGGGALTCQIVARGADVVGIDSSPEMVEAARAQGVDARLIERPTVLEHGIAAWVQTFRAGWLDRAGVPHGERAEIAAVVADKFNSDVADYVRLRFLMRKPV